MAFVNISTTAGESPYGVATASGAVHSIIATTRDARKLVLTTLGVQTAASGDVELLQIPVLGRVIEVLSVEQMQTLSGNPVYISGYKQNPITFIRVGSCPNASVGCFCPSRSGSSIGSQRRHDHQPERCNGNAEPILGILRI